MWRFRLIVGTVWDWQLWQEDKIHQFISEEIASSKSVYSTHYIQTVSIVKNTRPRVHFIYLTLYFIVTRIQLQEHFYILANTFFILKQEGQDGIEISPHFNLGQFHGTHYSSFWIAKHKNIFLKFFSQLSRTLTYNKKTFIRWKSGKKINSQTLLMTLILIKF